MHKHGRYRGNQVQKASGLGSAHHMCIYNVSISRDETLFWEDKMVLLEWYFMHAVQVKGALWSLDQYII